MATFMGHLEDVGITYFSHMKRAFTLSLRYGLSAVQLIIHGLLPFLFINAGKKQQTRMNVVEQSSSPQSA